MFNNFRPSIRRFLMASKKKIREEKKKKEIQRLEEEVMKQYISHFSIDR